MLPRPSWRGHLRLSLVSVPVTAYTTAAPSEGKVHFRQLHDKCHTPIKYQKVCPVHGEVTKDEIVLGYEYESGHYALVDQAERDAVQGGRERVMSIDAFAELAEIDPLYYDGASFYLLPENKAAEKPYAVLAQAMTARKCCGIGEFALGEKEQLMLVRPFEGLLLLSALHYSTEIKSADTFTHELASPKVTKEELKLAETLIGASGKKRFDLEKYEDDYTAKMHQIIKAKIAGKETIATVEEDLPPVINLMDALKKSVARQKKGEPEEKDEAKPARHRTMCASARKTRPKRKVS